MVARACIAKAQVVMCPGYTSGDVLFFHRDLGLWIELPLDVNEVTPSPLFLFCGSPKTSASISPLGIGIGTGLRSGSPLDRGATPFDDEFILIPAAFTEIETHVRQQKGAIGFARQPGTPAVRPEEASGLWR
jgi:hypothetical protein